MEPMRRIRKALISFLFLILAGALILECLNWIALPERARRWAEDAAGQALGRKVSIGAVRLHPWHGFLLERVSVAEDPAFGNVPFMEADQVSAGFLALRLSRPTVRLTQDSTGRWNFQSLGGPKPAAPAAGGRFRLSIPKVVLSEGRCEVHLQRPTGVPVLWIERMEADLHLSLPAQVRGAMTADLLAEIGGGAKTVGRVTLDGQYLPREHRLSLKGESTLQLPNLVPFLPERMREPIERLEGSLALNWETSGSPHGPMKTRGRVETRGLQWKIARFEGTGDLSGQVQWDPQGVRTEGLSLRFSNGTSIELSGALANDPALSFGFRATSSFSAKEPPPIPPEWAESAKRFNLSGQISLEALGNGVLRPKPSLRPTVLARLQEVSVEPPRGPRTQIQSGQIRWQPDLITFTDLTGSTLDQPFRLEGTLVKWDQPEINASFSWGKWDGEAQITLSSEKIDIESVTGRFGRSTFRLFGEINRPETDANLYGEITCRAEELPNLWSGSAAWVKEHAPQGEISARCLLQGPLLRPSDWNLEIRASSPLFRVDGIPLQSVSADLRREERRFTLQSGKAVLAGGNLFVSGVLDGSQPAGRWDAKLRAEGVQLDELAQALRWKTREFSGRLKMEWEGGGTAGNPESISGSGQLEVTGAQILEFPLLGKFAEFLGLPTLRTIRFQEGRGPFRVKQGCVETDSLILRSPQVTLTISGWGGFLNGAESPIQWKIFPIFAPELIPEQGRVPLSRAIAKGASYFVGAVQLSGTWKEPKSKFVPKKLPQVLNEQLFNLKDVLNDLF